MATPDNPYIFHIVHYDRLASIINDGKLVSDAQIRQRTGSQGTNIGISELKDHRLAKHIGSRIRGTVGQYVPFYFCPRSVMLFKIFKRTSRDLEYHGGQNHIIHLVFRYNDVLEWAKTSGKYWALTSGNAATAYTEFYFDEKDLSKLHWDEIAKNNWRLPEVKEAKQAEFLVMDEVPWELVRGIGVYDDSVKLIVQEILAAKAQSKLVHTLPEWYY